MHTLANSEDPNEMPHAAFHWGSTLFAATKMFFREKNAVLFGKNNNL